MVDGAGGRGVPVTVAAEVGDFSRFDNPCQLMACVGLVPLEYSTGSTVRRSGITKASSALARRALIEGAWIYHMQSRVSRELHDRIEKLVQAIRDIARKAQTFHVPRDHGGLADLIERLKPLGAERIAIEATSGFETVVAAALATACLPVVVVSPAQVRAFAQALGRRAKTDPIDAAVIARFAEATRSELRPMPDAETEALADLVTRRRQIIAMIGAENQRLKRAASRTAKSIRRLLKALEKELADIDQDIDCDGRFDIAERCIDPFERRAFWPILAPARS